MMFSGPHETGACPGRLAWQCRRGMRELDEMLATFLAGRGSRLEGRQLADFEKLLACPDTVLLELLMGRMESSDSGVNDIVREIRLTSRC